MRTTFSIFSLFERNNCCCLLTLLVCLLLNILESEKFYLSKRIGLIDRMPVGGVVRVTHTKGIPPNKVGGTAFSLFFL